MNNSSSTPSATAAAVNVDIFYQLIVFGFIAVIANAFLIITFFTNVKLLQKFSSIFGLAVGDFINGLALLVSGGIRLTFFNGNILGMTVHPFYCMTNHAVMLYIIGSQLPSLMLVVVSVERLTAVYFFTWYYKTYSNKFAWFVTTGAIVACMVSVVPAYLLVYFRAASTRLSNNCQTPDVLSPTSIYNIYNYSFPIVTGTIATIVTLLAMMILIRRKKKLQQNVQHRKVNTKEWHMTKVMTMVCALDFILVVLPNIFVLIRSVFLITLIPNFVYYSLQVICCRSALNAVIYLIFNRDFRKEVLNSFGFKQMFQPSISINVTPFRNSAL